nr:Cytoplasmic FMR1-interacting protein 2 [Polyrhizophydium stewartii]
MATAARSGAAGAHAAAAAIGQLSALATPRTGPHAVPPFPPVLVQGIEGINFADASLFDVDQYTEAKAGDRAAASKYFQKEASFISKMVRARGASGPARARARRLSHLASCPGASADSHRAARVLQQDVLAEGRQLVYTTYAFRSCGRAIPQVQAHNQEHKDYIYRRTSEILRLEIGRMTQLMAFRDKFVAVFTEALAGIIPDIRERDFFPSEAYLLTIAQMLDMVVSIDNMKNMKGSMNNDLSMYKRAMSNFPKEQTESEIMLLPKLAFFVAQQDQFAIDVKKAIAAMSNTYEDILHDMINLCVDYIDSDHYLTPATRYCYLRAMAFAVLILDGEGDERDFTKRKKLKVDKLGKIFKATPFVPLFGDLVISLPAIYAKAPHLANAKWDTAESDDAGKAALLKSFKLSTTILSHRAEFRDYFARANLAIASLRTWKAGKSSVMPFELAKKIYETTLAGLRMMSGFTSKAVRYNYDSEDKRVLVEYISMIKNLAALLNANLPILQEAVDSHIYREVQLFMKGPITQYYASATKKKRSIGPLLKYIRDSAIDGAIDDDAALKANVPQLHFLRALMDFVFNEKSKGMKGGLIKEKNFKDAQVAELQRFFDDSFFFRQMMQLSETIKECSDLSNLWFKEFYLELSKQVQFPISTSLPWILTEFILESSQADTIQFALHPLDLYNDAGFCTLNQLKSRVIFDEIEAEVNLCFDQLMFKLGQRIFVHYKKSASLCVLPADLKVELDSIHRHETLFYVSFEYILRQNSFEVEPALLGRCIDVTKIMSQMANQYLRRSIEVAITRFESSDLFNIMELESLLESAHLTHEALSRHLDLERFEDLVAECDDSLSLGSTNGRILSHVIQEIIGDIVPNFCFNSITQRFVRSPVFYTEPVQRSHFPKTRPMYLFGSKIEHTMGTFIEAVYQRCPKNVRLPASNLNVTAQFEVYSEMYRHLSTYGDLKSQIVQAFREIGNCMIVTKMLDDHTVGDDIESSWLV